MGIETGPRLGLSATPIRYGDPEGTAKIFDYFGPVIPPAISLQDAIQSGRLVEYEYHPHPVHLTAEEADNWKALTHRIFLEMNKTRDDASGGGSLSDRAKMLLIQRSRIAKKASGKIGLATDVLRAVYRKGQRWLVYCEDGQQLAEILDALTQAGLSAMEYHTGMIGDRAAALAWFRSFGGILVSIKCLDEGVDIPAVDHALILASSQNPRQFIQRRGRVLRSAPDKHIAVIHDAIVVPLNLEDEPEQLSLLKSEFVRAIEFAESAINRTAGAELRAMANTMGLDPDLWRNAGVEEEEKE
ncbi:MAG: helicase-related protein [Paraburkholderia sp.]